MFSNNCVVISKKKPNIKRTKNIQVVPKVACNILRTVHRNIGEEMSRDIYQALPDQTMKFESKY